MDPNLLTCNACLIEFELTLLRIDAIGSFVVCPYCGVEAPYQVRGADHVLNADEDLQTPSFEYPGSRKIH